MDRTALLGSSSRQPKRLLSLPVASAVLLVAALALIAFELAAGPSEDALLIRSDEVSLEQLSGSGAGGGASELTAGKGQDEEKEGAEESSKDEEGSSFINRIPVIKSIASMFSSNVTEPEPEENAGRVKVELYMEALCPGCQYFTTHVLNPVMKEKGMGEIIDLRIIPAGNAKYAVDKETEQEEIECQHGPAECEGNRILACLSEQHGAEKEFIASFNCIESHAAALDSPFSMLSNTTEEMIVRHNSGLCVEKHGISFDKIKECSESDEGEKLLRKSVDTTKALKPKMEYAPWVLVDGKPLKDDAYSLKTYICNAYKGVKPKECDGSLLKDYFPEKQSLHTMTAKQARHAVDSYFHDLSEAQKKAHAKAIQRSMLHKVKGVKSSQALRAVRAERPGFMFCAPSA